MVLPKAKVRAGVGPQLEKLARAHNEVQAAKDAYFARREAEREEKKIQTPDYELSDEKQDALGKCFELWCDPGHHELTRKACMKLFRDAGICGQDKTQVPPHRIDLLFEKHKMPKVRKICFTEFVYMLLEISALVDVEVETLVAHILEQVGDGPDFHNVSIQPGLARSTPDGDLTGPEKFFYDKGTFTGSHTKGGPRAIDSTDGYNHGLHALVHREHIQNDHVQRTKAQEAFQPPTRTSKSGAGITRSMPVSRSGGGKNRAPVRGPERFADPETFTGTHKSGGPKAVEPKSLSFRPAPRNEVKPPEVKRATNAKKGPERFFYDKTTFTGAHKQGGPDATYRTAGGYHDFSKLIDRGHVQDDHHNRRKNVSVNGSGETDFSVDEGAADVSGRPRSRASTGSVAGLA